MKTAEDIFDDIYGHIKASELATACNGDIAEERANGSVKEDITIVVFPVTSGQMQRASINVNIYVQDINVNGQWRRDKARCRTLMSKAANVLKNQANNKEYRFTLESQGVAKSYEGKNEHIINNRLDYQVVNI